MIAIYLKVKVVRYAIVGVVSTGIHIIAAFFFIYFVDDSIFSSNIFGFACAFLFSYFAQSKFVFNSNISFNKASKFFLVQFVSLLLAIGLTNLTQGLNAYFKVLIIVVILPLITFIIHRLWTFVEHESLNSG
jgi:putative flippase GtrA